MEWMLMPFRRYADFSGRSRRMEYWMFVLLNVIVMGVLFTIMMSTGAAMSGLAANEFANPFAVFSMFFGGVGIVMLIWWLFVLIPGIAVTVRRLHDRDMSGWWYLGVIVLSFIPLVGFLVSIAFLVIMFLDGTPGPNRFGEDPKGRGTAEVFS